MHENLVQAGSLPTSQAADAHCHIHQLTCALSDDSTANAQCSLDECPSKPTRYFRIKTLVDQSITAALMLFALPLMVIVALAVLICDGRPVIFRQVRVGKNGRLFRIWKFRTMQHNAEQRTGAVWSCVADPRVTRLGRWLRCSHLDELPQFLNVLGGDMNLVGPRPERPEFVRQLATELPGYLKRTKVRPGITGRAQLRFGYDESVAGIPQKVACDLDYIRTASFPGDFALLASTLPHIAQQLYCKWSSDRRGQASDTSGARHDPAIPMDGLAHPAGGTSLPETSRYGTVTSREERVA